MPTLESHCHKSGIYIDSQLTHGDITRGVYQNLDRCTLSHPISAGNPSCGQRSGEWCSLYCLNSVPTIPESGSRGLSFLGVTIDSLVYRHNAFLPPSNPQLLNFDGLYYIATSTSYNSFRSDVFDNHIEHAVVPHHYLYSDQQRSRSNWHPRLDFDDRPYGNSYHRDDHWSSYNTIYDNHKRQPFDRRVGNYGYSDANWYCPSHKSSSHGHTGLRRDQPHKCHDFDKRDCGDS